jgi:hypothetical protein
LPEAPSARWIVAATSATSSRRLWLLVAAVGYSVAWILGLMVPVPAVDLDAPAQAVLGSVVGHEGPLALRALLVHGFAGVALVTVAVALARGTGSRSVLVAGVVAAALSLVQFVLELVLTGPAGWGLPSLVDAVNRIDGVKMFALAALALAGAAAIRRGAGVPRWLGGPGVVLAAALVVSGVGYALLIPVLGQAAYVSLPLLLIWVTGTGVALAR